MTQPDNPVPARGARPQLFGEPKAARSRQPDFGPSILATIEGDPRHETRRRDGVSLRRVLWMSLAALGVVLVYFAVKFAMMPGPSASPAVMAVQAAAPVARPVETVTLAPAASAASAGAASIENVAAAPAALSAPAAASSPNAAPVANVTASLGHIQQVLAQSEASASRQPEPVLQKEARSIKDAPTTRPAAPPTTKAPTKSGNDNDAELLAAMLPHLKRRSTGPTSPAYEKRCGQSTGDAAVECRVRFCNGREGADAACPAAVVP